MHGALAQAHGRVVNIATGFLSRTKLNVPDLVNPPSYSGFGRYAQAKLASIMMTLEQAERWTSEGRNPDEDNDVWLVPCFFVRVGFRRSGITYALLTAAVELAERYGAKAIEGFPLSVAGDGVDGFLGQERAFSACGFECIARPTPRRAIMHRELKP